MDISLVAAIAKNGVIGHRGAIPWHLPADLKKFRAITIGNTVVMGRRTWESLLASPLAGPLPGRQNLVVSSSTISHPGVSVVRSFDAAIALAEASNASVLFAIGGAAIYREAIPLVTVAHITDVAVEPLGDAFFPTWEPALFAVTEEISWPATATSPAATYRRYARR